MTKDQREKETQQGREILRSQFDARRGCYKIVKYSRFGASWYYTDADCKKAITELCERTTGFGNYIDEANYKES